MSDLYEEDIVLWSERQAELPRRRAAGDRVNEADLNWPNIAEEIESVGSEQRHAVESLWMRALLRMLKAEAWPLSHEVPHWLSVARVFRADAARRFVPSMRQRIDLNRIYLQAPRAMPETIDGQPPLPVSRDLTLTLDELLSDE